ncbi:MAG: cytidylate kinase family protein [Desulfobacterales bacterium]|jgi:cytidylate kinase
MSIILISSEVAGVEEPIAQAVADALDYTLLGPEILGDIAARYDLTSEKLTASLRNNPLPLRREATKRWLRCLACIEAEVLERLKGDNIVCWGLAAHLYVRGVSHALKVRLLMDKEQQAKKIAEEQGTAAGKAFKKLAKEKRNRSQWSETAFDRSEADPSLYDLVINLGQIDPDEAVHTIAAAVGYRKFQPMTYSMKRLEEDALAARVKAKLLTTMADVRVEASDGRVKVTSKAMKRDRQKKATAIKAMAGEVEGVEFVEVHLINYVIRAAAESYR